MLRLFLIAVLVALLPGLAVAQVNFEIQVYGSETVAPGTTTVSYTHLTLPTICSV